MQSWRRSSTHERAVLGLVIAMLVPSEARGTEAEARVGPGPKDSDHDGVSDREERKLGLDPRLSNIPEPLLFDMVRGLGARRGELEVNVLANTTLREDRRAHDRVDVFGGPEMEYVFADGYGLEVELPLSTAGVEAWKFSLQGTLPYFDRGRFIHGWLATGEYLIDDPRGRGTAVYVAAYRFDAHWSALMMLGTQFTTASRFGREAKNQWVINPSIFYDASSRVTMGVEVDQFIAFEGSSNVIVLPQTHFQPTGTWKIQAGFGVQADRSGVSRLASLRVSTMF